MRRRTWLILAVLAWAGCQQAADLPEPTARVAEPGPAGSGVMTLLDFEAPEVPAVWTPDGASTAAAGAAQPGTRAARLPPFVFLQRTNVRPGQGRWSAAVPVNGPGEVRLSPAKPYDMSGFDLLSVQVAPEDRGERNGECMARLRIADAFGREAAGDAYPVAGAWRAVPLDLRAAAEQGVVLTRITAVSLVLEPVGGARLPIVVKTDAWTARANGRAYVGSSAGPVKSFFVESRGEGIHVGSVGQYEVVLRDQGDVGAASWMRIYSGAPAREVIGARGTGLYLLDGEALARVSRYTTPDHSAAEVGGRMLPGDGAWAWPASLGPSTLHWEVVWTSPVAAIIEGRQEAGGYDGVGEPVVTAIWRLMIYERGQVYVDVRWSQTGRTGAAAMAGGPASWALMLPARGASGEDMNAERVLTEMYPATLRQGMQTALPHAMQSGAAVALVAPCSAGKDNFWWSAGEGRRVFGVEIPSLHPDPATPNTSEATCMLLVNAPTALTMAGAFGQYLSPAKMVTSQGEIDRTFPGNWDNDANGFVETYGFQVVRLANGRATFTIYPQERPVFYPAILFTVPAAEREAVDVAHSKLLVNMDGKVFTDLPVFPDGSFLLQVPYVLERPVNVEARLVPGGD